MLSIRCSPGFLQSHYYLEDLSYEVRRWGGVCDLIPATPAADPGPDSQGRAELLSNKQLAWGATEGNWTINCRKTHPSPKFPFFLFWTALCLPSFCSSPCSGSASCTKVPSIPTIVALSHALPLFLATLAFTLVTYLTLSFLALMSSFSFSVMFQITNNWVGHLPRG